MSSERFKRNIFMPFLVLGDPDSEKSLELIKELVDNGAGALELGFAFSDPIADGPTIQKANNRALAGGIKTEKAFGILSKLREYSDIPISLMMSFNIMFKYGVDAFYKRCSELKIDAVLVPDVPLEESDELVKAAKEHGVHYISIIAPTTPESRIKEMNKVCSGYYYLVSLMGITGARDDVNEELPKLIEKVKKNSEIPVYVGFGISNKKHVDQVIEMGADGAISGSAVCKIVEENLDDFEGMKEKVGKFCNDMKI